MKKFASSLLAVVLVLSFVVSSGYAKTEQVTAASSSRASNDNYSAYEYTPLPAFEQFSLEELAVTYHKNFSSTFVVTDEFSDIGVEKAIKLTASNVGQKVISTARHIEASVSFVEVNDLYHYNGRALVSGKTFNGELDLTEYDGFTFWVGNYTGALKVMLHRANSGGPTFVADPQGVYGEEERNDEGAFFLITDIRADENGYVKIPFDYMHGGWMWWEAGSFKEELPSLNTVDIEFCDQKLHVGESIYIGDFKLYTERSLTEAEKLATVIAEVEARDDASENAELISAAKTALEGGNESDIIRAKSDLILSMKDDVLEQLYTNTYKNLTDRIYSSGYSPTSLTGAYEGMYLRDASCQILMHIAQGDTDVAMKMLRYIYGAFQELGTSVPTHIISNLNEYPYGNNDGTNIGALRALLNFGGSIVAEQEIPVLQKETITSVGVWLSKNDDAAGIINAELWRNGTLIATTEYKASDLSSARQFVVFEFPLPLNPVKDGNYSLKLSAPNSPEESIVWYGKRNYRGYKTFLDGKAVNGEASFEAFRHNLKYYSNDIQPDAINHIAYAWSLYFNAAPDTKVHNDFIAESFPVVLKYLDEYYKSTYYNSEMKLVRNPYFEHSREGRKWNSYDLLTNVFVSQTAYNLSAVAEELGYPERAQQLMDMALSVRDGINTHLIAEADGKQIYAELIDVDASNKLVLGMSWVNLAPCAVNWFAMDTEIMNNTFEYYRKNASLTYYGYPMLDACYDLEGKISGGHVIGKGFSWELMFHHATGDTERVEQLTDFLVVLSSPKRVFTESWWLPYRFSDVGNQEHASWQAYAAATTMPELVAAANEMALDVDGDGSVTVADALRVLRIAVFTTEYSYEEQCDADVDHDGTVTVADALSVLRSAAGLV